METFRTRGNTCCKEIIFEVENNEQGEYILRDVKFAGGCSGNLQGIAKLVKDMNVLDVIDKLEGVMCRDTTSCPDQLSIALKEYLERKEKGIVISKRKRAYSS